MPSAPSTTPDPDTIGVTSKTTAELVSITGYTGIYENWNINIDGQPGNDDPWNFGTVNQYPVLKYDGMDTTVQFDLQPEIVMLTLTPSTISENGGVSTVTARLTQSLDATTTITVRPVAEAYTVGMDSTIVIASGQTANASDTVVITAVDNNTASGDKRVTVLSAVDNSASTRTVALATLTIADDDVAQVTLVLSPCVDFRGWRVFHDHSDTGSPHDQGDDDHGFSYGGIACGCGRFHAIDREDADRRGECDGEHGSCDDHIGEQYDRCAGQARDRVCNGGGWQSGVCPVCRAPDDYRRRRSADGGTVAIARVDFRGERRFHDHGDPISRVERSDDDHRAPGGRGLHGGDRFDDHHRGRANGEHV